MDSGLLRNNQEKKNFDHARVTYFGLLDSLRLLSPDQVGTEGRSALAELIERLETAWSDISGNNSAAEFEKWLEDTSTLDKFGFNGNGLNALEYLDSLDGFLLSAIVESEQGDSQEIDPTELENRLQRVWNRTYAHFSSEKEEYLSRIFIGRGKALVNHKYPDPSLRRKIYRTSLSPVSAHRLFDIYSDTKNHLQGGWDFVNWDSDQKLTYLTDAVVLIGDVPTFSMAEKIGNTKINWTETLAWWLNKNGSAVSPTVKQISNWHAYISQNFQYRFNWGLGSILSLAIDESHGGILTIPSLEDWPKTGLPWIVVWIKELITWGTLDPVASFLLARNGAVTREEAEQAATSYYADKPREVTANEMLEPSAVRDWVEHNFPGDPSEQIARPLSGIKADAVRDFSEQEFARWRVIPVERDGKLEWFDVAGYRLASGPKPETWNDSFSNSYDFVFNSSEGDVEFHSYMGPVLQLR